MQKPPIRAMPRVDVQRQATCDQQIVALATEFNADAWAFAPEAKAAQITSMEASPRSLLTASRLMCFYDLVQTQAAANASFRLSA